MLPCNIIRRTEGRFSCLFHTAGLYLDLNRIRDELELVHAGSLLKVYCKDAVKESSYILQISGFPSTYS
jgi:hypothetical protein